MTRPLLAALLGSTLLATTATAALPAATAAPEPDAVRTVTLVGDLQSELGCAEDWAPACESTRLAAVEGSDTLYRSTFEVPAGRWEYKVALDRAWDEAYPEQNLSFEVQGPASLEFSFDDEADELGLVPVLAEQGEEQDAALAGESLRAPVTREQFYFVMADRFANGDTSNDRADLGGDRLQHGFDPTDKGFFHGGDLAGIQDRLDYIEGLGTTAIWLTPSFKNRPVQGSGADASAGYHGYWVTDFTQIDPHLGTNEEMRALVDEAHDRGMKVYFDIITNHTADVIDYAEGEYGYVDKETEPYRDAAGNAFDDRDYVNKPFPLLDPETSFPYTPVFRSEEDAEVKVPGWLNDPTLYHNRGDSTFAGESSTYGDFVGLDDLFTENPEVVDGMVDIYSTWAELGIDGFRIDTVKHVNLEFWQEFSPRVLEAARQGDEDFFMFGEVYDSNPEYLSTFSTEGKLQAVIDFGFQARSVAFARGAATTDLRTFYAQDDYYTDTDSNAYQLPTFTGNHDMGRAAMMLADDYSGQDLQDRVELTNALMFLTRGQPVVYYGDEQGFIGAGGDKDARQDMFATQVEQYAQEPVIGAPSGSRDRYDTRHPLYRQIAVLSDLVAAHPALADGAQIHRYASDEAGIYAFSRIDADEQVEYLVVANNSEEPQRASLSTYSPRTLFHALYGDRGRIITGSEGRLTVEVDPLSVEVYRAGSALRPRREAPAVTLTSPAAGEVVGGRAEIGAAVPENVFAQVTYAYRPVGVQEWSVLGTDDNAPYRVFHDVSGMPEGTLLEYRTILRDHSGNVSASSSYGIVGEPGSGGGGGGVDPIGPVEQPDAVSVPGSHNAVMGCPGDWQPDCEQAQLSLDAADSVWKRTYDAGTIPAGDYEYKAAIDRSWDENYGAGGAPGGANIAYTADGGPVSFYYEHARHYVTSDAEGPIITAPGSMQSELGCPADWSPACMAPWLIDPDGDGTYTYATTRIPAGNYEVKAAHGLSWDESYGEGGEPDGPNIGFSVPSDGVLTTFSYELETHVLSVSTSEAGVAPDLTSQRAYWVSDNVVAWPADGVGDPQLSDWRMHWAADGGLEVDAEAVTGGDSSALTFEPDGLPAAVLEDFPHLEGYLALRLDRQTARAAEDILTGQVAVARYDDLGRLVDATGLQVPGVLDDLYAARAADADLGVSWRGSRPTVRLWAPTAQDVDLLTWPAGGSGDPRRVEMRRAADGTWSAAGQASWSGREYLYEVDVLVPSTGAVETNRVTDPYSVGLTLDSARSVLVDLDDRRWQPRVWRTAKAPTLEDEVDQTIYELHVRDFSVADPDVPAELRGSYLAFAEDGYGRRHLEALADAGMNTVHLLPTFDIASIPEATADADAVPTPDCDLDALPPDSSEQQACVMAQADADPFNWGYDPWHFMAPEGSYASTTEAADGGARVAEFRTMVGGLHDAGLRVVLDQVFNHTAESGQGDRSVLDKVVPGYYHRLNDVGQVETSTCCQNVATEHAMAQKLMVDAVVLWARDYKVDGFRFDLMGHHSRANMEAVREGLDELTLRRDGVDGSQVTLYGEGWNFGEVADNARFYQATQGQLDGTSIGTFNDRLRDGVRGGGPFDEDPRAERGFATGGTSGNDTDLVQLGLAGNLRDVVLRSQETGEEVTGEEISYNGSPAGYAEDPDEVVNYVDAHDNETIFDALTLKLPRDTTMADRVRMNTLALSTTTLSQSISFWHAGADLLRSKSLDRNSYNSGDWFNVLDFTMSENGFGRGLPPAADNEDTWPIMQPLLADPALRPAPADIEQASAMAADLLRLRASSELFRLGDPELVEQKLTFPVSGTELGDEQVVVMRVDDTVGADADPDLDGLLVVFNAQDEPVDQVVPGLEGAALELSPVQAQGADPVVREATWDAESGTARVPARTVAVFVQP
ncbi:Neopullulanase [Serinicoccus hydrothermalis]|uniref:Neopullulanase n=1 Tax=Serinicoccus hydrothermalis TaxID=1758689 RepID=A0A1B1NFX5_9MICO|nr:pullulanase-type alpha-1,6-glucosidase [Serinicoccus hydrothermalis]ANS80331.1 Neopullulanase [Serinicoccus hydrothermalis]